MFKNENVQKFIDYNYTCFSKKQCIQRILIMANTFRVLVDFIVYNKHRKFKSFKSIFIQTLFEVTTFELFALPHSV